MSSLVGIFLTSFVIAFSGAIMPGPLLTAAVSETPGRGPMTGPMLMVGHSVLEAALLVALLMGLAPLLSSDTSFVVIALSGAVILAWMAQGMFRSLPGLSLAVRPGDKKGRGLVVSGVLLSLANPYWSVWWATIGLGYVLQCRELGLAAVAVFFFGHIAADFVWYAAVTMTVHKGKRFMSDRVYRGVIAVCATFLIVFAGLFAYSGLKKAFL